MIIRVWFHIADCGDGSAGISPFPTEAKAQKAADQEMEEYGQALCDNVTFLDLRVEEYEFTNEKAPPRAEKKQG